MTSTATAPGKTRKSEVTRYQMYIDGKFVDAQGRQDVRRLRSRDRRRDRHLPGGRTGGHRPRGQGGAPRVLRGLARKVQRAGARPGALPPGRADPRPARRAGRAGDAQLGQADRRVGVRHGRHRHLLRVLRRARHQDPRRGAAGARRRGRVGHAGADRRRRPDHPLELPAADGGLEDRAGARRGLHRGAQARRADAAQHPQAGRGLRGGRAAAGRGEHRHRRRPGRGRAAGRPSARSGRSPSPAAPRWAS